MGVPPSTHDPSEVRELADQILADPRYDRPPESLPDRIQGWFADRLDDVLSGLIGTGAGTLLAWMVVLGAIAAVAVLVARHGRSVRVDRPVSGAAPAMIELSRSPAEWRAEAGALEASGRWREALRCRHRALVGELVRLGAIPDQAGRTAGEYVRDIESSLPAAVPPMASATHLFEAAWYGRTATGADESDRFRALEAQVLAAGTRPRAGV